jgi:flagellar biosynthesis protein FlhA
VKALRKKIAMDLGFVVPPVRTRDNLELPSSTYSLRIAGVEVGRGIAPPGKILALGDFLDGLPGVLTVEPVFGLAGKWVPSEMRHAAEMTGAIVIDRVSVVVTHLSAVITDNAARLLSREDVRVLTDSVKAVNPSAVDELTPSPLSLSELQRVLQGLLSEKVPINDLARIYEALSLRAKVSVDPEGLIEAARQALGPALSAQYLDEGTLRVIMIDPVLEQSLVEGLRPTEFGSQILIDADRIEAVIGSLKAAMAASESQGFSAVLVCAPTLRPALRRLVSAQVNGIPVLSYQEATVSNIQIETVGVVRRDDALTA